MFDDDAHEDDLFDGDEDSEEGTTP